MFWQGIHKFKKAFVIGDPYSADFTIGTKVGAVRAVTIQLKDGNGNNVVGACSLPFYLSTNSTGIGLAGISAAGLAIASSGAGQFVPSGGDSKVAGLLTSNSAGLINAQITGDSGETYYLILVMPNGKIAASAAIAFGA